jgi:hypothetical protein
MAFQPIKDDSGKVLKGLLLGAGVSSTKHKLLKYSSGYLINAASGDDEVLYLALESVSNAAGVAGAASVDCLYVDEEVQFIALCSTTLVQATHVGNDYNISDDATVDLSNSADDKCFHIDKILNAASYLAIGRFNKPSIA